VDYITWESEGELEIKKGKMTRKETRQGAARFFHFAWTNKHRLLAGRFGKGQVKYGAERLIRDSYKGS
jgi:hypothetical protein